MNSEWFVRVSYLDGGDAKRNCKTAFESEDRAKGIVRRISQEGFKGIRGSHTAVSPPSRIQTVEYFQDGGA